MEPYIDYLKSKGRFGAWLVAMALLLFLIPVVISLDMGLAGKLMGVLLVITFSGALFIWIKNTRANKVLKRRIPISVNDRFWLKENIPFYRSLSDADKKIFEDRVALFLAEIKISDVTQEVPEKSDCFFVAASAVIAYWGLPYWNYGDLSEVLLYPDNFDMDKRVHKHGRVLGMVHHGGLMDRTMILSRKALIEGFRNTTDGRNVGIHEFTHLVDKADGAIEGLPVGLSREERTVWLTIFKRELEKPEFALDNYARTNTSEFYAVAVEMFRENPEKLSRMHPELYEILHHYYSGES